MHADVGRSCILLTIGGKNLMLDCGMHMGYNDDVSNISEHLAVCFCTQISSFICVAAVT